MVEGGIDNLVKPEGDPRIPIEWVVFARSRNAKEVVRSYAVKHGDGCHEAGEWLVLKGNIPENIRTAWEAYDITLHAPKERHVL